MSGKRPDGPDNETEGQPLVGGYPPDAWESDGYPAQPVNDQDVDATLARLGLKRPATTDQRPRRPRR